MYEIWLNGQCEVKVGTFELAAKYCQKYAGTGFVQLLHNGKVLVEFRR